jgi:L-asparagine transporter-like permease
MTRSPTSADQPPLQPPSVRNEQVLERQLSTVQQTMMSLGGAIGTGLFLLSGLAVGIAGPAVIVSYVIVAGISLLLGRALAEMAVAHPTAGAFGVYADLYLSPLAGYAVRVSYWAMEVIAIGGQLVAASIYMSYWFPEVPRPVWGFGFAAVLLYLNSRAVGRLGAVETWLVVVKLAAVALFIAIAVLFVAGAAGRPAIGTHHLTDGGFAPFGASGVWLGCCFVLYSFVGIEIVGVTSGEAADPARTIPRAIRRAVFGLSAMYIVTITLLAALIPWQQLGVDKSPFVTALSGLGIPAAAGVMNFVVLSAALSSANANLYLTSRTLFSLARAGYAPRVLGEITDRGAPVKALLASGIGLGATVVVQVLWPDTAYQKLVSVSLFGALFVWLMIFLTHIGFRRVTRATGSMVGAAAIAAILVSTWWVPGLETTLLAGAPWLAILGIGYVVSRRRTPG